LLAAVHDSDMTSKSCEGNAKELNEEINELHKELKKVKKTAREAIENANRFSS